jgi:hypothetical protein
MARNRSISLDKLNTKYDSFFKTEWDMNSWENRLLDVNIHFNSILWVQWAEPTKDSNGLAVTGGDVKHLSFPNFNLPFPFKKRR